MLGRNFWLAALLVISVVVPYHMSGDTQWSSINRWWQSMWSNDGAEYGGLTSSRNGWSVGETTPMASASPLPPNYSRRRIQSTGLQGTGVGDLASSGNSQPVHGPNVRPVATSIYSTSGAASDAASLAPSSVRPQFHDWMPVNGALGNRRSSGTSNLAFGGGSGSIAAYMPPGAAVPPGAHDEPPQVGPGLCGPDAPCISHLVSFDLTPAWVMNNWKRVSTRLADFELEGLRVPVITGTDVNAIVGSMTYYFDRRQTLQRISFDGYTGDPGPMLQALSGEYSLKAEPWLGAGLYAQRSKTKELTSILRICHAPVVRASDPRRRFSVEFEINRTDSKLGLSQRFDSLLAADRDSKALVDQDTTESQKSAEELEIEELVQRLEAEAGIDSSDTTPDINRRRTPGSSGSSNPSSPAHRISEPAIPASYQQANGLSAGSDAPTKPKPLNGSTPPTRSKGFLQRLLGSSDGTTTSGPRLYPSELPSSGQTFVPLPP